jgi:hypothetical protein
MFHLLFIIKKHMISYKNCILVVVLYVRETPCPEERTQTDGV